MHRLLAVLMTLVSCCLFSSQDLKMIPQKNWLHRSYEIYADNAYVGCVRRDLLRINTIYSVSDKYGQCARGIAKFFSLGTLSKGFKQIKVYDEGDLKIGYIRGNLLEPRRAQYTITDERKKPLAVAHLDETGSHVKIVHHRHRHTEYAFFERVSSSNVEGDYWEIRLIDEDAVDPRFLYIFAAFIADAYWSGDSIGSEPPSLEALTPDAR